MGEVDVGSSPGKYFHLPERTVHRPRLDIVMSSGKNYLFYLISLNCPIPEDTISNNVTQLAKKYPEMCLYLVRKAGMTVCSAAACTGAQQALCSTLGFHVS